MKPSCELCPRSHAELGVDVRQMARDRPFAEEERRRDFPVRSTFRDEGSDASLGRRQPLLARSSADMSKLAPSLLGPACRPELLEGVERLRGSTLGRLSSVAPAFGRRRGRGVRAPAPNGSPTSPCWTTACSRSPAACVRSPRAAATSPRQRVTCARTRSRWSLTRVGFPDVNNAHRLVDTADLEQRFSMVRGPGALARLAQPRLLGLPVGLAEPHRRGGRVTAPEIDEAEDREERRHRDVVLLCKPESTLRVLARKLELPTMDGNQGEREVVADVLKRVLRVEVCCASRMVCRELPVPTPQFHPGKLPQQPCAERLVAFAPLRRTHARAASVRHPCCRSQRASAKSSGVTSFRR